MKIKKSILTSLLLNIIFIFNLTFAQPITDPVNLQEIEPLKFPNAVSEKLELKEIEEMMEDLKQKKLQSEGKGFILSTSLIQNWYPVAFRGVDISSRLKSHYFPDLTIDIAVYNQSVFGTSINQQFIYRLLGGISEQYEEFDFELKGDWTNFQPNGYFGHLLGKDSYLIDYEVSTREKERIRKRIYIVQWNTKIFTFTLVGPSSEVVSNKDALDRLLHNLWIEKSS